MRSESFDDCSELFNDKPPLKVVRIKTELVDPLKIAESYLKSSQQKTKVDGSSPKNTNLPRNGLQHILYLDSNMLLKNTQLPAKSRKQFFRNV
jgi:hypothetical protein